MVVYFNKSENDPRYFIDEYKTPWEMDHANRFWHTNYGFFAVRTVELWPNESQLQRTRRLRKKS